MKPITWIDYMTSMMVWFLFYLLGVFTSDDFLAIWDKMVGVLR